MFSNPWMVWEKEQDDSALLQKPKLGEMVGKYKEASVQCEEAVSNHYCGLQTHSAKANEYPHKACSCQECYKGDSFFEYTFVPDQL